MANFKTHITVAAGVGATIGMYGMYAYNLSPFDAIMIVSLFSLGGLLPDIDIVNSKINKLLFSWIFIVSSLSYLFSVKVINKKSILMVLAIFILIIILRLIIQKKCKHRGIIHSIPIGIFMSTMPAYCMYKFNINSHYIIVLSSLFFGFIIHLILDEIYSVDLRNMRIRKSFGSAFKFKTNNFNFTVIAYFLAASGIILIYNLR